MTPIAVQEQIKKHFRFLAATVSKSTRSKKAPDDNRQAPTPPAKNKPRKKTEPKDKIPVH